MTDLLVPGASDPDARLVALTPAEVKALLDAIKWTERMTETGAVIAAVVAKLRAVQG